MVCTSEQLSHLRWVSLTRLSPSLSLFRLQAKTGFGGGKTKVNKGKGGKSKRAK